MADDLIQRELMLSRFRRLIGELIRGSIQRNSFQPWEVSILSDMEACPTREKDRNDTLRQYEKAVEKQLEAGPGPPMTLSEFLQAKMTRRPSMR